MSKIAFGHIPVSFNATANCDPLLMCWRTVTPSHRPNVDATDYISCRLYNASLVHVFDMVSCESWQKSRKRPKKRVSGFKVIQGHRVWHQSKGHMRLSVSS